MTPLAWTIIACICFAISASLLIYAWRVRHRDALWRHLNGTSRLPPCCQAGVDEISRTTITGGWTCPSCGRPHTFVDGQPGRITDL